MNILVFGFSNTIAQEIVNELEVPCKFIIESNVNDINNFIDKVDFDKYDYILGLGEYSGRDKYSLRIETTCSNKFRNSKDQLEILEIPYYLSPSDQFKLTNGIGNSWCNLVSYKILKKAPNIKYSFVHVPRSFDASIVVCAINNQLSELA